MHFNLSLQGPRAGWGFVLFFSTDFVSDQSESGASAREHPVVMGRMLLAESFPYLPEGGLHPDKPQALPLVGAGAGWG